MKRAAPSLFSFAISVISLLLTLVVAEAIWESYYPRLGRESLRRRREYYEKVLRPADLSWQEGLYYNVMEGSRGKR